MKKSIIIASLTLVTALTGFTSCSDFLDKEPSSELTKEKTFSGWVNAQQFHWDTYNFLRHGARRINNSWLDAATDLAECAIPSSGTRTSFNIGGYYSTSGASELTETWESRYRGIRKCNMTLAEIDSVARPADESVEQYEKEKAQLKSEARFFRAYFHWELFLRYGTVPIVKEVLDPNGDLLSNYTTRPSLKEFINFIVTELDQCASGMLTYEEAFAKDYAGRLCQPIPLALKSRIYLYMASPRYASESGITWQQAADVANEFIGTYGTKYSLYQDATVSPSLVYYNALLRTPYEGDNKEIIFYRNDATISWGDIRDDTPIGEGGNGGNCPSQNLVDMYDMIDGSAPFKEYDVTGAPVYNGTTPAINTASGYSEANMWANRDPRLAATVLYHGATWNNRSIDVIAGHADNMASNANATPTGYYMRKYIPETILASNHGGSAKRLWTIIRYAEILLNYAEALNEVQGPCDAVYDLLDRVRQRAGITGNVKDRQAWTQETMRNFIHKERTVEFAFEEHRFWDVRRWNCADKALARPIYGVSVSTDGTITRKVAQERIFDASKMYLYPIPEGEVWKTNIQNNPGW